jgi:hypothetical protein
VYHSIFRSSSNALQISSLRCGLSECSQSDVCLMMSLLKRNISHLSRKCPIGLPIWNSLSFLMINVASGSESVGNGSFVTKRSLHLGLHRGHRGEVTTYMTCNQRYDLDINTCQHSACHSRTSSRSRQNMSESTHLARRVRSYKTMGKHPELSKAWQNMTCLRDLTLLDSGSSNILKDCLQPRLLRPQLSLR